MSRTRPYTERGIARIPCAHCNLRPSAAQWTLTACAQGGMTRVHALCAPCDVALNRQVLMFMRVPDVEPIMTRYEAERL